ncbi:ComEC/Rec2 family competence protein [Nitrosopumilus sp. b2]|uniref:ComEC/Rec2 family competence protein n=1 Tax=Nitrosopumilus sp. b2 TaxID=2109908 RepID=UPI0015F428C9|nr:ComEC/Rec2 family competence protein [Nitrosopumilus sp. b2]
MVNKIVIPAVLAVILASATGTVFYYDSNEDEPIFEDNDGSISVLQVHFIDVGQGDSTLILTPSGYSILVDGGNNWKGDDVFDYISSQGIDRIDLMIATHPDADHIGGLDELIELIDVGHVIDNGQPNPRHTATYADHITAIENINRTIIQRDRLWDIDDDTEIELIVPYDDGNGLDRDPNANSILVKISYGGKSVLLTGDCEKVCEQRLLDGDVDDSIGDDFDIDILKVGHHGSDTSTSEEFLVATSPVFSTISVGNNQWGHPKDEVLNRLIDFGSDIYRTDESGTIVATIDETGIQMVGFN